MPNRVAGHYTNQVGGDFRRQPAPFDNPALTPTQGFQQDFK